jgi:hypothetical protein
LKRAEFASKPAWEIPPTAHAIDHRALDAERGPVREGHAVAFIERSRCIEQSLAPEPLEIVERHARRSKVTRHHPRQQCDATKLRMKQAEHARAVGPSSFFGREAARCLA